MKNVGNSSRGHSQGVSKISSAPMYMAHCAVIFAIAQLSCSVILLTDKPRQIAYINNCSADEIIITSTATPGTLDDIGVTDILR